MPVNGSSGTSSGSTGGPGGGGRTTFRPPWVKENAAKKTADTPSTATKNDTSDTGRKISSVKIGQLKENGQPSAPPSKLQSREIKVPIMNTKPTTTPSKPKEKEIKVLVEKDEPPKPKEKEIKVAVETDTTSKFKRKEPFAEKTPIRKESLTSEPSNKFMEEVKLKPVLKKTPKVDDTSEKLLATPVLKPVMKRDDSTDQTIVNKLETPALKPVLKTVKNVPEPEERDVRSSKKIEKPILKPVAKKEPPELDGLQVSPSKKLIETPVLKPVKRESPERRSSVKLFETPVLKPVKKEDKPVHVVNKITMPPPPPPPPGSGIPPPPPPMNNLAPPPDFQKKPISEKHKKTIEKLKTRPRRRPDWSDMMKEVEQGRKLRHVECNDRSKPILTCKSMTKVSGQFIYETEKANIHNVLLKQIQGGVRLKPTRTNDRSKPILEGLRKFRRQMTIEEQIQKSESRAVLNNAAEVPAEVSDEEDEMDDIDKLRDDLQSTKQMLALELRNKEAQERENKRLASKIQNLEAELERERTKVSTAVAGDPSAPAVKGACCHQTHDEPPPKDERLLKSLKAEAEDAQRTSKMLEGKYQYAAEQLDKAKSEIEEQKRKIAMLERQLTQRSQSQLLWHHYSYEGDDDEVYEPGNFANRNYYQGGQMYAPNARRDSEAGQRDSSPEPEPEISEGEEGEDEEKKEERRVRRLQREVRMMRTKLNRLKDKESVAKREREGLKSAMKKQQQAMKEEKKKYKVLQKEVDKMAALMRDDEDDEEKEEKDEDEANEEAEEEEDSGDESDDESETEESESEEETESESEADDAPEERKKWNLEPRVKRHEGRLAALKKGNYLHQANVDRLKDEVSKQRELSIQLQHDLDSVLSELG